ncbi:MAG TPA: carbon-nitrogen hydrolase [Gemmatimonadaceae bacterium]|nr:carbon-nitrogen hydrolase [Gemmatimonadaceae bacterium]
MPARAPVTIGLIQDAVEGEPTAVLAATITRIREAAAQGAEIICLKELFNAPYFCKSLKQEYFNLAEPIPGPTTDALGVLAAELGVVLVVPMYEREAAGVYRNSAAVIDADGALLGVYRKMHLPHDPLFEEKYYFAPGDAVSDGPGTASGFKAWKTRHATIGVLICWDQWYPEAARITSLLGAEILFFPTAIGWHPAEKAEWGAAQVDAWRTAQRAHAIANGVFVAVPNRVGFEPEPGTHGLEFFGRSFVCDPFGRPVAEAEGAPAILVARCDLELIESTRRAWPFLRDRRIDAYGPILNRWLG